MFVWGGGGGACSFGRKIGIKFFLDWARGRAQQRAPAAPIINATRRLIHHHWSSVFDVDTLTAFVDLRQLVYCEAVKGHTCIHCAKWAWFCIAFYLVSCRFSDRWRGRFKQPSRGRPSRPSRCMENLRWDLEIRPCTVSLSTPSVESARELAPSLSARRRTSGGRCARIPLTWGGASTS